MFRKYVYMLLGLDFSVFFFLLVAAFCLFFGKEMLFLNEEVLIVFLILLFITGVYPKAREQLSSFFAGSKEQNLFLFDNVFQRILLICFYLESRLRLFLSLSSLFILLGLSSLKESSNKFQEIKKGLSQSLMGRVNFLLLDLLVLKQSGLFRLIRMRTKAIFKEESKYLASFEETSSADWVLSSLKFDLKKKTLPKTRLPRGINL